MLWAAIMALSLNLHQKVLVVLKKYLLDETMIFINGKM